MENYFNELSKVNVNGNTEKKGQFTYLSWAFAWGEVKKIHPNATYNIHKFGENKKPYLYDEDLGYMVFTDVTINGLTHEMWLPVMDFKNKAIMGGKATMMEINKAIMRCLVKNIGMHGLGLYIYAGEDMPSEDDGKNNTNKASNQKLPKTKNIGGKNYVTNEDNSNVQKAITSLFNELVVEFGSNEIVYENIGVNRETFVNLYKNDPDKLWETLQQYA